MDISVMSWKEVQELYDKELLKDYPEVWSDPSESSFTEGD